MEATPKRAAMYARTATQEIGQSSATDAQIQACIAYASEKGYQVVDGQVYTEIASGASANRHLLLAALAAAQAGLFDVLIICDYARLARNTQLLTKLITQFEEAGVTVETVRNELPQLAAGQFVLYERQAIRERTKRPPYGYAKRPSTSAFTLHPQEASAVQRFFTQE